MTSISKQKIIAAILFGAAYGFAKSVAELIFSRSKLMKEADEATLEAEKATNDFIENMNSAFKKDLDKQFNETVEKYKKEEDDMVESLKRSFEPFRLTEKSEGTGTENEEA